MARQMIRTMFVLLVLLSLSEASILERIKAFLCCTNVPKTDGLETLESSDEWDRRKFTRYSCIRCIPENNSLRGMSLTARSRWLSIVHRAQNPAMYTITEMDDDSSSVSGEGLSISEGPVSDEGLSISERQETHTDTDLNYIDSI
jgi:hypothetical protein